MHHQPHVIRDSAGGISDGTVVAPYLHSICMMHIKLFTYIATGDQKRVEICDIWKKQDGRLRKKARKASEAHKLSSDSKG